MTRSEADMLKSLLFFARRGWLAVEGWMAVSDI